MSKCPSKQAALSGVELVLVVELTLAPRSVNSRTAGGFGKTLSYRIGSPPSQEAE